VNAGIQRRLLVASAAAIAFAAMVGARWTRIDPAATAHPTAQPVPSSRVRVRPQRAAAPACPDAEATRLLADVRREVDVVQLEASTFDRRARMLGAPLPDDLPDDVQPDMVAARVRDVLPEGAELVLACDTIPCSGAVVLDPSASGQRDAEAFRAALEEAWPGAAYPPSQVDDLGHATEDRAAATVVFFSVVPQLETPEHRARLHFLSKVSRSRANDRLRALLAD
jgi:hypothetical protein